MVHFLYGILMLMGLSLIGIVLCKRRFEECFAVSLMGIGTFLYLFYIFDQLPAGTAVVIGASLAGYVILLINLIISRQSRRDMISRIFTPAFVIFVLLLVVCVLLQRNDHPVLWDELRLWAAAPKAIYYTGKLQLGSNTLLYRSMQTYPPMMSLLQYYLNRICLGFEDFHLQVMYSIFSIAVLIFPLRHLNWKQWKWLPLIAAVIFLIPLLSFNSNADSDNFYTALYIDPIVALTAGYCIYCLNIEDLKTKFGMFSLCLSLAFLTNCKDTGILLSAPIAVGAAVFLILTYHKECSTTKKNWQKNMSVILWILLPLFVTAFYYLSWKYTLNYYHAVIDYSAHLNLVSVIRSLFHPTMLQKETAVRFLKDLLIRHLISSPLAKLFSSAVIMFLLFLLLLEHNGRTMPAPERKLLYGRAVVLIVASVLYVAAHMFLYICILGPTLPSYTRYLSTVVLINETFLYSLAISVLEKQNQSIGHWNKEAILNTAIPFGLLIILTPYHIYQIPIQSYQAIEEGHRNAAMINEYLPQGNEQTQEIRRVFYADDTSDDGYRFLVYENTYYKLMEKKVYITDFLDEMNVIYTNFAMIKFPAVLQIQQAEYVYFSCDNQQINDLYQDLFLEGNYQENRLYKVIGTGSQMRLKLIQ